MTGGNYCVGSEDPWHTGATSGLPPVLATQLKLELMIPEGVPHTHPYSLPRSSRCIPLAVWATETNQKHF